MSDQSESPAFILKLNLLQNSHSFLSEALAKAVAAESDLAQWKFAIFNLTQAIELSLKERLRLFHPLLILQNVDKREQTVTLKGALLRLCDGCNLPLSRIDVDTIKSAAEWRNQIVHSEFALNTVELKSAFAKLIGFVMHFHRTWLNENLEEKIETPLWRKAVSIQAYGEELFERAKERFAHDEVDPSLSLVCPKCGWEAFVIQNGTNTCYVCGCAEDIILCDGCGQPQFVSQMSSAFVSQMSNVPVVEFGRSGMLCLDCADVAHGARAEPQIEIRRRKQVE